MARSRPGLVLTVVLVVLTIAYSLVTLAGIIGTQMTRGAAPAAADSPLSTPQAQHFMLANLVFGVVGLVGIFRMWNRARWGFELTIVSLVALFFAQLSVSAEAAPSGFRSHGRELGTVAAALVLTLANLWDRRRRG